jgi:hypothetical protein
VPQKERREQINRFKNDADCLVFLSSDSGGVGLNLQAASVVINLDLPWNPAKLEQRIARAWRKHQSNAVNVINLVAENTIEHRMLATLSFKQELADGVLDGRADFEALSQPSARARFMERLEKVFNTDLAAPAGEAAAEEAVAAEAVLPPSEQFRQEIGLQLRSRIGLCKASVDSAGRIDSLMVVSERDPNAMFDEIHGVLTKTHGSFPPDKLTVLTPAMFGILRQLAENGLVTLNHESLETVFEAENFGEPRAADAEKRRSLIEPLLKQAERHVKMATVLAAGGFPVEAVAPMRAAAQINAQILAVLAADPVPDAAPAFTPALCAQVEQGRLLGAESMQFLRSLDSASPDDEAAAAAFIDAGRVLLEETRGHV